MQAAVPLACFLSVIRPPGVQYENSLLQIAPVDKSKCPYVKDGNDVAFQLFTRHNPTVYQDLMVGDDEKLFASNMDFHDKTVLYFHAWMETTEDGSAVLVREAYMQRGDTNVIMVDARSLQAGPWYFTAAQNTWYIGRFVGQFIDYLVTRGLNLNNTHLVGHSLGAQVAGVAGSALKSGKVARITGLDAALPLFEHLPLQQRLDPTDAKFVDTIHTDGGIFGYKAPIGHVDFYPNAGISPQPGCELEVVIPKQMLLNKCDTRRQTNGFYTYYLKDKRVSTFKPDSLEYKLEKLFTFIQAVRARSSKKDNEVILDKVKANIISLNNFKEGINGYLNYYDNKNNDKQTEINKIDDKDAEDSVTDDNDDGKPKTAIGDKVQESNINLDDGNGNVGVEDQIAEESGVNNAEIDEVHIENSKELVSDDEEKFNVEVRRKREANINKSNDTVELTVESANLTLINDKGINKNKSDVLKHNKTSEINTVKTNADKEENNKDVNAVVMKLGANPTVSNPKGKFKKTSDDGKVTEIKKKPELKPFKLNLFRTIPILRQIFRVIPRINKKERSERKETKFSSLKNTDKAKKGLNLIKIGSNINPISSIMKPIASLKKTILKRQKRFLPFFQRAEDSNNILFRMLDFLVKNRKNVLPVFTVVREINTLVRSANGELNHVSKESNNYIGATPPVFTPVAYSLELGNENRITAFVKKLFGLVPKGDRLTIAGGK